MAPARLITRALGIAVAALALAVACVNAAPAPEPRPEAVRFERPVGWANDRGDLPRDPDYTLGTLSNGMRYVVLPHRNPPGQVAMRMVISAGSMQERPGEEGIAHFLEHLAFRGTKSIPDGELQRRLEGLGLQMGSDVNATTGSDRTTFMLNMARNDAESLDTGLLILREIVSEIALAPETVNTERGVVLAEERVRAGPELDAAIQAIRLQVGDHPYGRAPIGKTEVIRSVTPEQIRTFYDAYYRPERATLVVVGDIAPDQVLPAIKAQFESWVGRGEAGGDPDPVTKRPPSPDVSVEVTEGSSDTNLQLRWFQPYRQIAPTLAERRRLLVESLGAAIVGQRMQGLTEAAGRPARSIGAPGPSRIPNVWNGQSASAGGVLDAAATIDVMVKAHRQAVQFGVTQEELDRIIGIRLQAARQAAAAGRTGSSPLLAEGIAASLASDPAFVSPKDTLAIIEAQLKTITLNDVNAALRARFTDQATLIYRGPKQPEGGEAALRTAFAKASAAPVMAYAMEAVKPWPYSDFGPAGKIAERREVEDLGITFVRFENDVRLSVKKFTAQKDQVNVQVRLGLGRLGMPRDRIDASDMGVLMWSTGGLNKLTRTEQSRTLAGKRVLAAARTGEDAYVIDNAGITTPADFGTQMQLMAAMVSDPAYRTDDWSTLMADSDQSEAAMPFSAAGVMQFHLDRLLHSDDLRWTYNTAEMRRGWRPEDAVAYIRPIVRDSPIEVIVVGDIDVDIAISDTARTLGALPRRAARPEPPGLRDVKFPTPVNEPVALTHKGRVDQGFALVAWPTQGTFDDVRGHRVGWVLGQMLRDQATRELRSGSGATYSPDADVDFSRDLPGYGYIAVMVEVPPDLIDGVLAQMQGIATRLGTMDMPASEVRRIVAPRIEQSKRDRASSASYWMQNMAGAQADPKGLDLIRTQISDYESITTADIQAAARRWLKPETAWKLKVVPEAKGN